ncbi:MAG: hypothetical protein Q7R96_03460 [Nanoarchaeota archaeon]|nr:hypothetical protein [Nanoarchaeota archaeon]
MNLTLKVQAGYNWENFPDKIPAGKIPVFPDQDGKPFYVIIDENGEGNCRTIDSGLAGVICLLDDYLKGNRPIKPKDITDTAHSTFRSEFPMPSEDYTLTIDESAKRREGAMNLLKPQEVLALRYIIEMLNK